jgi:hypothetical protein
MYERPTYVLLEQLQQQQAVSCGACAGIWQYRSIEILINQYLGILLISEWE